jgi:uncharacterized protein YggE
MEVHVLSRQLLALAVALGAAAPASAQPAPELPAIVTTGQSEVKMAPDRAWVEITADSRARDPKEAQRQNVAAMESVMAQLKGMNLGKDAIRTLVYEVHPEFDYTNGKQVLRGYVARNSIEVRVDDVSRVGDVLGAAVNSAATSVGGLRFGLKDRDAAEREALRLAVADARARAEAAASGAGVQIARIQKIEEQRIGAPEPPRPMMRMAANEAAAAAGPPITPGTIEIRAMVTLTASIK